MKKLMLAPLAIAALCVTVSFAGVPSQDKPVTKTTSTATVKKTTTPMHAKTMTKSVHKKHVKNSE